MGTDAGSFSRVFNVYDAYKPKTKQSQYNSSNEWIIPKPRATRTQHRWIIHLAFVSCWLRVVGSCWAKFGTGQTFEPTTPNISFIPCLPKGCVTMSDPFAQLFQRYGSLSIDDGNGSENVTFKKNSRFLNTVEYFPICWKWQMRANFPRVDFLKSALNFIERKRNSSSIV